MDNMQYFSCTTVSVWPVLVSPGEKSSETLDTTRLGFCQRYRMAHVKFQGRSTSGKYDIDGG